MAGHALTTAAQLECPHRGTVQISGTNQKVSAGAKVVTMADTLTISDCQFQLPTTPPTPSPCKTVQWVVPDMQVRVDGKFTVSRGSVGLCLAATQIPQGAVVVSQTQQKVSTR